MSEHQQKPQALDQKFVELLVKSTILPEGRVESMKSRADGNESVFEKMLIDEGYLIDEQLGKLKAQAHRWSFIDLRTHPISEEDLLKIPRAFAHEKGCVFFTGRDGRPSIAMENPGDLRTKRLLEKKFGKDIQYHSATRSAILAEFTQYEPDLSEKYEEMSKNKGDTKLGDTSAIKLVDELLLQGVRQNVSDIHIEPGNRESTIRQRVDGILRKVLKIDKKMHSQVVLRIKVLANLETDEHATPQDGKFHVENLEGRSVDVRVSMAPTTHGEKIVMRLLIASEGALTMESLGMQGTDLQKFTTEKDRPWGMVLVTGPTGSGKTTTLYAGLRTLNNETVNISTIEDPVEYDLPGVAQIQVNEKTGLTFASGLRTLVRQDPNIILVGEVRDEETASIAVNAAMTGHLVLSTLHTNDAATALPRLADMGVEPFLVASTVNVIVAQRLVRKVCVRCREGKEITEADLEGFPDDLKVKILGEDKKARVYEGKGCSLCHKTGFRGRSGIFELLQVDQTIRDLILKRADSDAIRQAAKAAGMTTMVDDGIAKVLQGITTIEEMLRVIRT